MKKLSLLFLVLLSYCTPALAATPLIQCNSSGHALQSTASPQAFVCAAIAAGTPGGTSGQVQYNNGGAFGGFGSWNGTTFAVSALVGQYSNAAGSAFINPNGSAAFGGGALVITSTGSLSAANLTGTNSGDVTLTAVGSTPSANGASLSGQALTLQPADGTHPGLVTSGPQAIGGAKTFAAAISASNLSGTNTGDQVVPANTTATTSNYFSAYNSSTGVFTKAQPAFSDITGNATNAQLASQTANTLLGALTATTPSGIAVPSCTDTGGNHLNWTSGTGFSCGTSDLHAGTVTSASVTTANGVSATVATATTTPAFTFTLGAITPSTVNGITFTGATSPALAVTGTSSISGSNTGDQVVPANTTSTASNFFTAYNSGTGAFTKAQPAFSDISGNFTLAQFPSIANNTVLGNVSGISGVPTALTATQHTTLVNVFTSSLSGAAPASGGGTSNFLRADGAWTTPGGGGTVTTTGTPATGNLTKFSGATSVTNGDLSGDCTTSGTLAINCTKTAGVAFAASATTDTTNASNIGSGTLGAARLPNPTASTLGGIESITAVTHRWINSISTLGVPTQTQPACGDLSDSSTGCTTTVGTAATANTGTSGATLPFLNGTNTWSGVQTYTNSDWALLGSSTGKTTFTSDNAGASNFTLHVPAANDTIADLAGAQAFTNKDLTGAGNTFPTFNQNTTGSAAKWTTARNLAGNSVDGSANVAFANKFIVQGTTDAGLSGAQFLGALSTGVLKNTTTTGVLSNAAAADIVALFSTCSGTQYLGADGACHTAAGAGTVTNVATDSTLTGGPITNTGTLGINLSNANTWAALQTYGNSDIAMLGSSTGFTTFTSANAGASNFTITFPAATDQLVGRATTDTLTNKSIAGSEINSGTVPAANGGAGTITGALKANGSGVVSQAACGDLSNGAASCSTDTTNATNISSGTLAAARGGAGTITGALKGSGAGVVSQAACGDLSNGATGCSTATGTSGATIPLLNGANTFSALQTNSTTGVAEYYSGPGAVETGVFSNGNSGTSKALNLDNGNKQSVSITGAVAMTLTTPTHPGSMTIIITMDATGHVYSLAGCKWPGGSAITYSTAANAVDIISILYNGTTFYCMGGAAFS